MRCKFRNIEFHASNIRYGRGTEAAETNFLADTSKSQNTELDNVDFVITGFIYGRDVEQQKIALEGAFEKKSGILLLPDGRSVSVELSDAGYHFERDNEKEGYYGIEVNFKKRDKAGLELKVIEIAAVDENKIKSAVDAADISILDELNNKLTFDGFPAFVKMSSLDTVSAIVGKISRLSSYNLIGTLLNPIQGLLDIAKSDGMSIGNTLNSYLNFGEDGENSYNASISAAQMKVNTVIPENPTPSNLQIVHNNKALEDFVNQSALVDAMQQASTGLEYKDINQAQEIVEQLLSVSKDVTFATDNFEVQDNINTLLNLSINYIRKKHTPKTRGVKYHKSMPAIVIAHQQYGTNGLEAMTQDIIGRNHIRNALFSPAGKELEVLDV